jgi:hypothetical protein
MTITMIKLKHLKELAEDEIKQGECYPISVSPKVVLALVNVVEALKEVEAASHLGDGTTTECNVAALAEQALSALDSALRGSGDESA